MEPTKTNSALQPRGGGILGPVVGVSYLLRALRVFQTHKDLRPFVILPVVINTLLGIVLYSTGMWWGFRFIKGWQQRLIDWLEPNWLDVAVQVLSPVIQAGLVLILFAVLGLLLLQFGSILGSPFYGQLSEKVEILRTGRLATSSESMSAGGILKDIWRAVLFELKKLLLLAGGGILLLLANVIPGVGAVIATAGSISLAVLLVCLDMLDAPLERRRLGFRQKLIMIVRCFPASGSFGLVCLGLVSIPLMNLLAIPLCVSAGTLFFCDRMLGSSNPPAP